MAKVFHLIDGGVDSGGHMDYNKGVRRQSRHRTKVMETLGQSAFDYLVDEAIRDTNTDDEFNYFMDITLSWVSKTLPDFYLEDWEGLTEDQQLGVVDELKEEVNESFKSEY